MIIIGLSGSIASGKTTFASFLDEQFSPAMHWESWLLIAEVGNALRQTRHSHPLPDDTAAINNWLEPLPVLLKQIVHKNVAFKDIKLTSRRLAESPEYYVKLQEYLALMQAKPALQSGAITEDNKEQLRSLLQWLGGYLVNVVDVGIWYDEIIRRIQRSATLDGATIGGVRFPGDASRIKDAGGYILTMRRPGKSAQDTQDLTERERELISPDAIIINDGSLDQLQRCAVQVVEDLRANALAQTYQATTF